MARIELEQPDARPDRARDGRRMWGRRRSLVVAAALASLAAATLPARPAHAAALAVFDNARYVDTNSLDPQAEADNIRRSLERAGNSTSRFTKFDAAGIRAALASAQALVIPELEVADLAADMTADAKQAIADYVFAGGGMIIAGTSNERAADLLNQIFGWNLSTGVVGQSTIDEGQAAGTFFEGGVANLAENARTRGLNDGSLPQDSRRIYSSGIVSTVVLLTHGLGRVVYLGWDWFDAKPRGTQDGGWISVLDAAVAESTLCLDTATHGDSDGDGLSDACAVLSPCVDVDGLRDVTAKRNVVFKRVLADPVVGDDGLKIVARFDLPAESEFSSLLPRTDPVGIVVKSSDERTLLDVTLPTTRYRGDGTTGWKKATKRKWLFKDESGSSPSGIVVVRIKDRSARSARQLQVVVLADNGRYPLTLADAPLRATVVVGDGTLGECAELTYTADDCSIGRGSSSMRCAR